LRAIRRYIAKPMHSVVSITRVAFLLVFLILSTTAPGVPYRVIPAAGPVDRGRELEAQGKIQEARQAYREAIESEPDNAAARLCLAKSYAANGDSQDMFKAITELGLTLSLRPDSAEARFLVAKTAAVILIDRHVPEGRIRSPAEDAANTKLLKHFVATLEEACAPDAQQVSAPVKKLGELLASEPDALEVRAQLFELAKILYARALEKAPGDVTILTSIANLFWGLGAVSDTGEDYAGAALAAALKAEEAAPYDHNAIALVGKAYSYRAVAVKVDGDTKDGTEEKASFMAAAEESYRRAIMLGGASQNVMKGLADIYAAEAKTDQGVEYFTKLAQTLGNDAMVRAAMEIVASLHAKGGRPEEAEEQWMKVLQAYPAHLQAYLDLAKLYVEEKQPDKAISLLDDLLKEHPAFLNAHEMLGRIHLDAERMKEAEKHYLAAVRLRDDGPFEWVGSQRPQDREKTVMSLFHSPLSELSKIYSRRNDHRKAGDIILQYKSVYFRTNPRGNTVRDADGHLIPREPRNLPIEAMLMAGAAYLQPRRDGKPTDRAKALESLTEAVRISYGRNYRAREMLARAHLALLRLNADPAEKLEAARNAQEIWNHILERFPKDPNARYQAALLMFDITRRSLEQARAVKSGRAEHTDAAKALVSLSPMLQEHPNDVRSLLLRASICEFLGDAEKALKDANAVLAVKPDDAVAPARGEMKPVSNDNLRIARNSALALMAWIHTEAIPDLDKAEQLARESLEAGPAPPGAFDTLAWIYYRRAMTQKNPQVKKALLTKAMGNATVRRPHLSGVRAGSRFIEEAEGRRVNRWGRFGRPGQAHYSTRYR